MKLKSMEEINFSLKSSSFRAGLILDLVIAIVSLINALTVASGGDVVPGLLPESVRNILYEE